MSSDENQQALAWQQIIKNRAFYNVRVQRGESWVDAACRTLDELIDQKEQAENAPPKIVWRERALEAERYLLEARRERDAAVERADEWKQKAHQYSDKFNRARSFNAETKARAEQAERERDEARRGLDEALRVSESYRDAARKAFDRADTAQRTVGSLCEQLARADIEKVIRGEDLFERQIDAVWSLVSGSDAAVFNVRESDISAVEVKRDEEGDWWTENHGCGEGATVDGMRQMAEILIRDAIEYEAIARAIEAEQAADPIEEKAAEFYDLAGRVGDDIWAACRNIAAHVLGQEDRHVNQ